jgi:MFS family permease
MAIDPRNRTSLVVALGGAQTLAWGSTYYLPAILAQPMGRDLGLTSGWVFAAFSTALLVSALLGPPAGHRIDRHGGRGVLATSSIVFAAGLAALGLATGPVGLFAAWLLVGVGMGIGLYDAAFTTLTGIYGREARTSITGITLIAGFASTICWPISAVLEAELGWRATCFAWAAAHLLIGLPVNRLLIPFGVQPAAPPAGPAGAAAPAEHALLGRSMLLLAFVFAATWFTSTAMGAHLPNLLMEAGASTATAIAAAGLVGPAQVAARVAEFSLLRRHHPLLSARIAVAAHPIGGAILLLAGGPVAYLFTLLHGAGNGVLTIAKGTLPLALFGPSGYGLRQGWLGGPARIGQAAAPVLFALMMEWWGVYALGFTMALGVAGLLALLALRMTPAGPAGGG